METDNIFSSAKAVVFAAAFLAANLSAQTLTTLHSFENSSDGAAPSGGLVVSNGVVYGTCLYGGNNHGATVFSIPAGGGSIAVLHSFVSSQDGTAILSDLVLSSNMLFGAASEGGAFDFGTIFGVETNGLSFTNLHTFSQGTEITLESGQQIYTNGDGVYPGRSMIASGNVLYGTTSSGGSTGSGIIFRVNTDGSGFVPIYTFSQTLNRGGIFPVYTNTDGASPSSLLLSGTVLYGTSEDGGANECGTVFSIRTNGSNFTVLHTFNGDDGQAPVGGLCLLGGILYGTTSLGNSNGGYGTIFALSTNGGGFTVLHSFTESYTNSSGLGIYTNTDGSMPYGTLVLESNLLYGTTFDGGSNGFGTVFSLSTNGTGFTTLHTFGAALTGINQDGGYPESGLTLSGNTFYGTTSYAGAVGSGTVFSLQLLSTTTNPVSSLGCFSWETNADNTITITSYNCDSNIVTLPSEIGGLPVTSLADGAFGYNTNTTTITIPSSLVNLGAAPFVNCVALTNISVAPDNAAYVSVGGVLFNGDGTVLVEYPPNLAGTAYSIPGGVDSLGVFAFGDCANLASVSFPASLTNIGNFCFSGCSQLTNLPLPDRQMQLGVGAFQATGVTTVSIPSSMTSIPANAFAYCLNLTNATIAAGVTNIGESAFFDTGLAAITIPVSVTTIGSEAFGQSGLASVFIPDGVVSLGAEVFEDCYSLTNISVAPSNASYSSVAGVLFDKAQKILLQYPAGSQANFYAIPSTVASIADDAFSLSYSLSSVSIPDGVTNIGAWAFASTGLTAVTVPASVQAIGDDAFAYCYSLIGVYFLGVPPSADSTVFYQDYNLPFVYYLPGQTGWGASFAGIDTSESSGNLVLTLAAEPQNEGSVAGQGIYATGTSVTITATPYSGYSFLNWTENGRLFTTAASFTFAISNGLNLVANFTNSPTNQTSLGFTTLYTFSGGFDGGNPGGGLAVVGSVLYGSTAYGGLYAYDGFVGYGTIFSVETNGQDFANPYNFNESPDGSDPSTGVIASQSTLYGVAMNGGDDGYGTVYSMDANGSNFITLHSFSNVDGAYPEGGLILAEDTLYGTTAGGASNNSGTVFKINTNGTGFTTLHNFASEGTGDGAGPSAGVVLSGSTLYGTTALGGANNEGTIFSINSNGSGYKKMHDFGSQQSDGIAPKGQLALSGGMLYGTTSSGGEAGDGTVFTIGPSGSGYQVLHSFSGNDGANPVAGVFPSGNYLYGTTANGGAVANAGTVFAMSTDGSTFTNLYSFTGGNDGSSPNGPVLAAGGLLYGTTLQNGATYAVNSGAGTVFSMPVTGVQYPPEDFFTYNVVNGQVTITGYSGPNASVVIPNTISGLPVTAIGSGAFSGLGITSVTIPDTVKSIGGSAFFFCSALVNVIIPNSVLYIGPDAFIESGLTNVTIGSGVTNIGADAFASCQLISVYDAGNAPSLGFSAFYNNPGATVYYPLGASDWTSYFDGLPTEGISAAYPSINMFTPLNGQQWGSSSFDVTGSASDQIGVSGVWIQVNSNGWQLATSSNNWLSWNANVALSPGTNTISAFSVEAFGNVSPTAFSVITYLTNSSQSSGALEVTIMPVLAAAAGAQWQVDGGIWRNSETVANNLTVGTHPISFSGAPGWLPPPELRVLITAGETATAFGDYGQESASEFTFTTNDGEVTITGYTGTNNVVTIPSTIYGYPVTAIGSSAFYLSTVLSSIILPDTVTSVGANAFYDDSRLTNVTMSDSVTNFGADAFVFCSGLQNVVIPAYATIGYEAFLFTGLTNVYIPPGINSIAESAFSGCPLTAITVDAQNSYYSSVGGVLFDKDQTTLLQFPGGVVGTYTIPGTVTNISDFSFAHGSLPNVVIPSTVIRIGIDAYYESGLTNVTIMDGVEDIAAGAFQGTHLGSVTVPGSVTDLEQAAFNSCFYLTNAVIQNGVPSIGQAAFAGCPSLTTVVIPLSVTSLAEYTFDQSSNLVSVYFQGSPPSADDTTFYEDPSVTAFYAPGAVGWGSTFAGVPAVQWTFDSVVGAIVPPAAINAGAQWAIDGGAWLNSGVIVSNLSLGSHSIIFKSLANWTSPGPQTVVVSADSFASVTGIYNQLDVYYSVNTEAYPAGGGSVTAGGTYFIGTQVTLAATPYLGYEFSDWTENGIVVSSSATYSFTLTSNLTLVGNFASIASDYSVSLTGSLASGGRVTGGGTFAAGSTHMVVAVPNAGYVFTGWMENGRTVSLSNSYSFVLNNNVSLVANFVIKGNPKLTITSPKVGQSVSNDLIQVIGSVTDKAAVDGVYYQLSGAGWTLAATSNSWSNWTASVSLNAGANTISAYAVDVSGAFSPTNTVALKFIPSATLSVQTNGLGSITPVDNGKLLAIGTNYTLTASPDKNWLFSNWVASGSESFVSNNPALKFSMQSNLVLTANFVTNLFLAAQGAYHGLFAPVGVVREETNSGSFALNLLSTGVFTGDLFLGSNTVSLAGKFNVGGYVQTNSTVKGGRPLTTILQLDVADQAISGTVSDGSFVAQLDGDQNVFGPSHPATEYAGQYTWTIPGTNNALVGPYGTSYGTVTVNPDGDITFVGSLADGTAVSQSSAVSKDGRWPMYLPSSNPNESVFGWNYFTNQTLTAPASVSWIDVTNKAKSALYPCGFTNQEAAVVASYYTSAAKPILSLTEGQVTLEGGGLPFGIINQITLEANNTISVPVTTGNTNKLKLTITPKTGLITGSFQNPANPKQTITISGVLLQNQTNAQGYFLGTNQTGVFLLETP